MVATVSPWRCRTDDSRSLVLVLPEEPVMPMTTVCGAAVDQGTGERDERRLDVRTTTQGRSATGREVSAATAPWAAAMATNWWPSNASPTTGDVEAAGGGLA